MFAPRMASPDTSPRYFIAGLPSMVGVVVRIIPPPEWWPHPLIPATVHQVFPKSPLKLSEGVARITCFFERTPPLESPPFTQGTSQDLIVEGARQNNLKNISLHIPHNRVTAIT